jgi:hypothetical protein
MYYNVLQMRGTVNVRFTLTVKVACGTNKSSAWCDCFTAAPILETRSTQRGFLVRSGFLQAAFKPADERAGVDIRDDEPEPI